MFESKMSDNYISLGEGYYLEPLDYKDNRSSYSYLYLDGSKLSNMVFRKGGFGGTYEDGYCSLLAHPEFKKDGKEFGTSGIWSILNLAGEIVMMADGPFGHDLWHKKGLIAVFKDEYYNLETGEVIAHASTSNTVETDEFLWIQHDYDWKYKKHKKQFPLGVYKINYYTGEVEFFKKEMNQKIIEI